VRTIYNPTEQEKKEVCQCRTCNTVFKQSEVKRVDREHLGQTIKEAVCPNPKCGSANWGLINPLVDEEINTYKSKNFHKKDKRYKYNMKHYNVNDFIFDDEE
jgi:hypothetical protein